MPTATRVLAVLLRQRSLLSATQAIISATTASSSLISTGTMRLMHPPPPPSLRARYEGLKVVTNNNMKLDWNVYMSHDNTRFKIIH